MSRESRLAGRAAFGAALLGAFAATGVLGLIAVAYALLPRKPWRPDAVKLPQAPEQHDSTGSHAARRDVAAPPLPSRRCPIAAC